MISTNGRPWITFAVGLSAIYGVALWLLHSPLLAKHSTVLGAGIAADLTLTAAVLFWCTLVRNERLPSLAMTPFLVGSAALAWWLLRDTIPTIDSVLIGLVAAAEIGAASLLIFNLGRIVNAHRAARRGGASFDTALAEAVRPVLKSELLTELFVTEVSLLYHATTGWWREPSVDPGTSSFTYHRSSNWQAVAMGLCLMLLVELVPVHLLLASWQPVIAWVVSALTVYSVFWVLGDFQAMRLTPIVVDGERVRIRIGRRWDVDIDLADIVEVRLARPDDSDEDLTDVSLIGGPDVVIERDEDYEIKGIFGIRKPFRTLALPLDEPGQFIVTVEEAIAASRASGATSDATR